MPDCSARFCVRLSVVCPCTPTGPTARLRLDPPLISHLFLAFFLQSANCRSCGLVGILPLHSPFFILRTCLVRVLCNPHHHNEKHPGVFWTGLSQICVRLGTKGVTFPITQRSSNKSLASGFQSYSVSQGSAASPLAPLNDGLWDN